MPPKQVIQPKTNVSHKWIPYTVYVADQIVSYIDPTVGTIKNFCMNTGFSSTLGTPPTTTGVLNTGWSLTGNSGGGGVAQIVAGTGITISPTTGKGTVSVSQTPNSITTTDATSTISYSSDPITTTQTTLLITQPNTDGIGFNGGINNLVVSNIRLKLTNTFGGTPVITTPSLTITTRSSEGPPTTPYWNFTTTFGSLALFPVKYYTPIKSGANSSTFLGFKYAVVSYAPKNTQLLMYFYAGISSTFLNENNQVFEGAIIPYSLTPYPYLTLGTELQQTANPLQMYFSAYGALPIVGSYIFDGWPNGTSYVAPMVVQNVDISGSGILVTLNREFYKGNTFVWTADNYYTFFNVSSTSTASPYTTTDTLSIVVGVASAVKWTATGTYPNVADPVYVPSSGLFYTTNGGSVVGSLPVNGVEGWTLTSSNAIINTRPNLTYLTIPGYNILKPSFTFYSLPLQYVERFPQSPFLLDPQYNGRVYFISATLGPNPLPATLSFILYNDQRIIVIALD